MDGCTDDLDILQIFTTKYDSLYNSVGLNSEDVMLLLEDINTDAMNLCYDRDNSESHFSFLISHFLYKHNDIITVEGGSIVLYIECLGDIYVPSRNFLKSGTI